MRFMMIVKANAASEAGVMPSQQLMNDMMAYNEALTQAGILRDAAGLKPSANGYRIKFSGGNQTLVPGPFPATGELIAGYWLIEVDSPEAALEWAKRAPAPFGRDAEGEIELRPLFGLEDFEPGAAIDKAREIEAELKRRS